MNHGSGGNKRRSSGEGWKGRKRSPKHADFGWQEGGADWAKRPRASRGRWHRQWTIYSLVGVILLAIFLGLLLIRPAKTPVLLITGINYSAPVPPNRFAMEDREALKQLSSTLTIAEISDSWLGTESDGYQTFRDQLAAHRTLKRGFRRIREPVIIYFSMPGVVDERGDPCLLPPGASPFNSEEWLNLESIVREIDQNIPSELPKLLVLDSNQVLTNWGMGIVYNTFPERLKAQAEKWRVRNLAVLTSADEGQTSSVSPQLNATAFGHFFRLGIAGAADRSGSQPDGMVSLSELVKYLQKEVGGWAESNRGSKQKPVAILSQSDLDFELTHALGGNALSELEQAAFVEDSFNPQLDIPTIVGLWKRVEGLRELEVLRYDPIELGKLEQRLLYLEQLIWGGRAYQFEAGRVADELTHILDQASKRSKETSPTLADHWAVTNPVDASTVRISEGLSSLPLRNFFGQEDAVASDRVQGFLDTLLTSLSEITVQGAAVDSSLIRSASALPDTQLMVAFRRRWGNNGSRNLQFLRPILSLRSREERLAVPSVPSGDSSGSTADSGSTAVGSFLPGDERAHYYVRLALEDGDKKRRLAEDSLYVALSSESSLQWLSDANKLYDNAAEVNSKLTEAFAISDTVLDETPHLAEWLCRPGGDGRFPSSKSDVEKLLSFIRDSHRLAEAINRLPNVQGSQVGVSDTADRLVGMARNVSQRLSDYREKFEITCSELEQGGVVDGAELFAVQSVLASPMIPAELRGELLKKQEVLAKELNDKHFAGSSLAIESASHDEMKAIQHDSEQDSSPSTTVAERMVQWPNSPLLEILEQDRAVGDVSSSIDRINVLETDCWTARKTLRELSGVNVQGAPLFVNDEKTNASSDRLSLSRIERYIRAVAPIGFESPSDDPISRLRRFDLQQLLIWHARRALDDFWHKVTAPEAKTISELLAPSMDPTQVRQTPFFAEIAENYLSKAEGLYEPCPPGVERQISSIRELKERRLAASIYGLQLKATSRPVFDSPKDVDVTVEFRQHEKGPDLPDGLGAVYLVGQRSRSVKVSSLGGSWGSVELPVSKELPRDLRARAEEVTAPSLKAVVFFRGRQYQEPFEVNSLGGAVVQYEPPVFDQQSVTLMGDQPSPPSVVFILDCSGSMDAKIAAEDPGTYSSRMEAARTALETMLGELSRRRGASRPRIGVLFFGHRVAWKPGVAPPQVLLNTQAAGNNPIPKNISPAVDVERVLPLGDFSPKEFGDIDKRLRLVEPHGLTPVNLAIVEALKEFDTDDNRFSKSIIVITDGKNDQRHPQGTGFPPVRVVTADAVIRAWDSKNERIPIHIVGFGIPEGERGEAERDFKRIADHTKGQWLLTNSGGELIDRLRKQLDVNGYVVRQVDGLPITKDETTGEEKPIELNTEVILRSSDYELPINLEVAYQAVTKRVLLEGGEALRLRVIRDGNDITYIPYDEDVGAYDYLVRGTSAIPTNYLFRVHRPRRSADKVSFRLSLQDQSLHFTRRPQEIWCEVSPEGSKESYLFYDRVYEPHTPVPVIDFKASNWPEGQDYARVKFWCNEEPTESVMTIRLSDLPSLDISDVPFQPVPQVAGVRVRAGLESVASGEFRVLVEEDYDRGAATTGAIRVLLNASDAAVKPTSISHRFDAANGVARHQFSYQGKLSPREFADAIRISIASGEMVKKDALHLEDESGLRVQIFNEDATLAPSASGANGL